LPAAEKSNITDNPVAEKRAAEVLKIWFHCRRVIDWSDYALGFRASPIT